MIFNMQGGASAGQSVVVEEESGTVRFTNGSARLTLGFVPDVFFITTGLISNGLHAHGGANFGYSNKCFITFGRSASGGVLPNNVTITRNGNVLDFTNGVAVDTNWGISNLSGSYSYVAYKFT